MYRKKIEYLKQWKESQQRKPLLLIGARQVWKTFLLKEFWKQYYKNTIYINFENIASEVSQLFDKEIDPKKILLNLEIYFNEKIIPGETLIIFDEIQDKPRVLTSLKYFCELANEYHIVASWSLLGTALHLGTSFPTWKVDIQYLYPLDFEEFLLANNEDKLIQLYKINQNDTFNEKLYEYFKYYLYVWWMPEIVFSRITEHNFEIIDSLQWSLLQSYRYDFSKHTDITLTKKITQIWESIPLQFAKENDKFIWGVLREWARAKEYEIALQWLCDSGLVRKVTRVKRWDKIPLSAYKEEDAFKLYFLDVWLLRNMANIPWSVLLNKNSIFDEFNGLIAEQFVLQNMDKYHCFYWTSWANAEVDFVTQINDKVIPIEVKSWENTKSKSLRIYREKYSPDLSIRYSLLNLKEQDWLVNIPLYLIFCLDEILKRLNNDNN